jgi:hypothetical protein
MSAGGVATRTLHLVDIENLVGGPDATGDEVVEVFERYLDAAAWEPGDLVYVAANPWLAREFAWRLPVECNVHTAHGRDGADLALLAHAAPEFVSRRATRLVVGSGDHVFIARALEARALGVGVLVVARGDALHGGWRAHNFPVLDLSPVRVAVAA